MRKYPRKRVSKRHIKFFLDYEELVDQFEEHFEDTDEFIAVIKTKNRGTHFIRTDCPGDLEVGEDVYCLIKPGISIIGELIGFLSPNYYSSHESEFSHYRSMEMVDDMDDDEMDDDDDWDDEDDDDDDEDDDEDEDEDDDYRPRKRKYIKKRGNMKRRLKRKASEVMEDTKIALTDTKDTVIKMQKGKAVIAGLKTSLKEVDSIPVELKALLDVPGYSDLAIGLLLTIAAETFTDNKTIKKAAKDASFVGAIEFSNKFTFVEELVEKVVSGTFDKIKDMGIDVDEDEDEDDEE